MIAIPLDALARFQCILQVEYWDADTHNMILGTWTREYEAYVYGGVTWVLFFRMAWLYDRYPFIYIQ